MKPTALAPPVSKPPRAAAAVAADASTNTNDTFFDPYQEIRGIPTFTDAQVEKIKKLCGPRVIDILLHMPTGTVDRRELRPLCDSFDGAEMTSSVTVGLHTAPYQRGRQPYRIRVADDTAAADLVFFSYGPWLLKSFPEGTNIIISGAASFSKTGALQFMHPQMALAEKRDEIVRLQPTYPLTQGLTQWHLFKAVQWALEQCRNAPLQEWLPEAFLKEQGWPSFMAALNTLHNPEDPSDIALDSPARQRLAMDEFYCWQIALQDARRRTRSLQGFTHDLTGNLRSAFLASLPYTLTGDQKRAIMDIDSDMKTSTPMCRLVQGDVGSGKTMVAFAAILNAVESGHQAALLAPTEILATQHYENALKTLAPLGIKIALLVGKQKASQKKILKHELKAGLVDVVIGTHAIIQKDVAFKSLSLAVIDEQHRFGVRQRLAVSEQDHQPDLLVMTATPIPRTLALTAYGDMDISIIAEKPPGRTPITTRALPLEKMADVMQALKRVLDKGEQAYWVCPLVDESEKSDMAAASERAELIHQFYGKDVGLLHGKMKPELKEAAMDAFKRGDTKILVSTTVIEVGVDVPQATVMVIEHAERFGLAQLHQLRGRIGRNSLQSSCILLYKHPLPPYAKERIETLRNSEDGFVLAEKDLELRGPGEVIGTRQSGFQITRLANFAAHKEWVGIARDLARTHLEKGLSREQHMALQWLLRLFEKDEAARLLAAG